MSKCPWAKHWTPKTAPDVLGGTLHGSHRHQCMNVWITVSRLGQKLLLNTIKCKNENRNTKSMTLAVVKLATNNVCLISRSDHLGVTFWATSEQCLAGFKGHESGFVTQTHFYFDEYKPVFYVWPRDSKSGRTLRKKDEDLLLMWENYRRSIKRDVHREVGPSFYSDWKVWKTACFPESALQTTPGWPLSQPYSITALLLIHNACEDTESLQLSEDTRAD